MSNFQYDFIICGGGAAGFFSAINIAENNPKASILILEKSGKFLDKVRISGGGRCNVTHACWEPKELVKFYPRGSKELIGPFHRFMCGDMLAWLDNKGIETNIEEDGRIFPSSNNSQTIIDCFTNEIERLHVKTKLSEGLKNFTQTDGIFRVQSTKGNEYFSRQLVIATGGTKLIWALLADKNIQIVPPVPSLFTFKISHPIIQDLPGLSVEKARVKINGFKMETVGPVLITHWGLSGPGILKLSSWAARYLHGLDYQYTVRINWIDRSMEETLSMLQNRKEILGKGTVFLDNFLFLPKRLWKNIVKFLKIENKNWADLTKKEINDLANFLCNSTFTATGKSTNKDEFVTSGGIALHEVNFKTMESKKIKGLYFAGEVLDIDALTGGFNFQSAWTTSWIIGQNKYL